MHLDAGNGSKSDSPTSAPNDASLEELKWRRRAPLKCDAKSDAHRRKRFRAGRRVRVRFEIQKIATTEQYRHEVGTLVAYLDRMLWLSEIMTSGAENGASEWE